MCQKTPSRPLFSAMSSTAFSARLTPSNWWFFASFLTRPSLPSSKAMKFSTRSRNRAGRHVPLISVSRLTTPGLLLVVDPLPFVEEFERRVGRAEHGLEPVRQDDEGVRREDLRDRRAIVGEVAVVGVGHRLVARLEFDEQERQAVDEADEIGALGVEFAREPDLRGEEEVVRLRVVPVDDADDLGLALAALSPHLDRRRRCGSAREPRHWRGWGRSRRARGRGPCRRRRARSRGKAGLSRLSAALSRFGRIASRLDARPSALAPWANSPNRLPVVQPSSAKRSIAGCSTSSDSEKLAEERRVLLVAEVVGAGGHSSCASSGAASDDSALTRFENTRWNRSILSSIQAC